MGLFKWVFSLNGFFLEPTHTKTDILATYIYIYDVAKTKWPHKTTAPSTMLLWMDDIYNKHARTVVIDSVLTVRVAAMVKFALATAIAISIVE